MKKMTKVIVLGCFFIHLIGIISATAAMDLETESSVAGISVALNNYYASSLTPEVDLANALASEESLMQVSSVNTKKDIPQVTAARSPYENVAISRVSNYVNVRQEPNTTSAVTGKIYNNCAATILTSVKGEGGEWYQIQSGQVTGYIKAQYFITGSDAEAVAKQVGKVYATVVNTDTLRLRESPNLESKTLTLLAEGAQYVVVEENGDFAKLAIDSDLEGYVFKDYIKTNVEFMQAVSLEEEQNKAAEDARLKKDASDALAALEEVKRVEELKITTTVAKVKETQTKATTAPTKPEATTVPKGNALIAANPEGEKITETKGKAPTTAAATTAAATKATTAAATKATTVAQQPTKATTAAQTTNAAAPGPGGSNPLPPSSGAVTSATRNAIVAYSKQFLGNPYVYGGTSLTNGADCSGFTQAIYANFGIATGRSSRDQAAKGRQISLASAQPGDLFFYASGDYINHVAMYIGGGQVIHSSSPTTGIIISPSNYRTPCKVVTFLD